VATTLPTPIEFRLPEGWRAAPPDEVGAPGAAFVALHGGPADGGFTANITVDGDSATESGPDVTTLTELADASVETLRGTGAEVTPADRTTIGTDDAPGLTQTLRVRAGGRDLVQAQVYLEMRDVERPERRAVIRLVLTATATQFPAVLPDFQSFVWTVRPDPGDGTV
jgi:hypothetical protein